MRCELANRIEAHLHYLQLGTPHPYQLAQFANDVLQMTVTQSGQDWICRAPGRLLIYSPGLQRSLLTAGYAVSKSAELAGLKARLVQMGTPLENAPTGVFEDDAVTFRDPDGNRLSFGRPIPLPPVSEGLPARLQQVVLASTDAERMTAFYTDVVGLRVSDRVLDEQHEVRTVFMRTDRKHHSLAVLQASESGLDHYGYETTSWNLIRDWSDHFSEQGVMINCGPGRHGPGNNLFIFIHDPDQNWLQISAELESVGERRPVGVWRHTEHSLNQWAGRHRATVRASSHPTPLSARQVVSQIASRVRTG
jgi:catechol 2,3-dioxygenase-like lactoylglutathione lyase family enzyme